MKVQFRTLLLLVAAAATAALARAEADDATTTASVKFSAADKPGTLRVDVPWGDLKITGDDVAEITVRSSLNEKNKSKRTRDGLRRLDEEVSFELVEKDNVVTLSLAGEAGFNSHGAEFEITVPRSTSVELKTDLGGDIDIRAVEGDIGIETMNGEVRLADVVSSASVSTMNGEITASFKTAPVKPVSFSSMNGEIDVRLPAATKANLRMRTHNGSILTDFAEDVLKTKAETKVRTVSADAPDAPEAPETPEAPEAESSDAARVARSAARDAARDLQREAQRLAKEAQRANRESDQAAREMQAAAQEIARNAVQIAAEVSHEVSRAVSSHRLTRGRAPRAPVPPIFGGKAIVGTLNGGGVDISLTSMNGSITVRETK